MPVWPTVTALGKPRSVMPVWPTVTILGKQLEKRDVCVTHCHCSWKTEKCDACVTHCHRSWQTAREAWCLCDPLSLLLENREVWCMCDLLLANSQKYKWMMPVQAILPCIENVSLVMKSAELGCWAGPYLQWQKMQLLFYWTLQMWCLKHLHVLKRTWMQNYLTRCMQLCPLLQVPSAVTNPSLWTALEWSKLEESYLTPDAVHCGHLSYWKSFGRHKSFMGDQFIFAFDTDLFMHTHSYCIHKSNFCEYILRKLCHSQSRKQLHIFICTRAHSYMLGSTQQK